ncbi:hypothetical protein J7K50_07930 [bacterium]|nr:hypothetical protein [bacterium]
MNCPICSNPMEYIESLPDWTTKGMSEIWADYYEESGFSVIQLLRKYGGIWHCPNDFAVFSAADPSVNNLEIILRKFSTQIESAKDKVKELSKRSESAREAVLKINFADRPNLEMMMIEGKLGDLLEVSVVNAVKYQNARKRFLRKDLLCNILQIPEDTKFVRGDIYLIETDPNGEKRIIKVI